METSLSEDTTKATREEKRKLRKGFIPIRCLWYNTKRKEGTHSEAEGHYGQNHACSRALAS